VTISQTTSRAAFAVFAACALELAARQVARHSLCSLAGWPQGPSISAVMWLTAITLLITLAGIGFAARRTDDDRRARADRFMCVVLAAAFVFGLAAQQHLGARLQSDGFFYFAYLRSMVFDRDVDLANDYERLGVGADRNPGAKTVTGHADTAWSIGPALVWSPFFGAGHLVARGLAASGDAVRTDGTSFPYRQAVCMASLFYGLLGLWFCYALAARFVGPAVAAVSALTMGLGSFIVWYMVKEPTMSHAVSMAAVACFVWAWVSTDTPGGRSRTQMLWLGLAGGLMLAIRWQNLIFMGLPAMDLAVALARGSRDTRLRTVTSSVLFGAAVIVGFLPQMLAWQAIFGSPLAVSPNSPDMLWGHPQFVAALWSSKNGLFATSPVVYAGAIGLLLLAWRVRPFGVQALVLFVVAVYVNSVVEDWWGGAAFGGRRFDGSLPLLAVGLAAAIESARDWVARRPLVAVSCALAALVTWNLTYMSAALNGDVPLGLAWSFASTAGAQGRALERWVGHPFSYPVNLIWAARNGVDPDRYDILAFPFLADPAMPYGRVDVGGDDDAYVGQGWHGKDTAPDGMNSRWTTREAELLVPLDHAAPLMLQPRILPLTWAGGPPPHLRITVNGRILGDFPLRAEWQRLELPTTAKTWRAGVNRVRLTCLTAAVPAAVGLNGDPRELGVAVDYVRVQVIK
jgi:hypothetical protein